MRPRSVIAGVFVSLALACSSDPEPAPPPSPCTPGTAGCACAAGGTCTTFGTFCNANNVCEVACPPGAEGCPCAEGVCSVNARGAQLSCHDGLCLWSACPAGDTGCACRPGGICSQAGDTCRDGYCQPQGCTPGQLHCACASGHCASGLVCRDGAVCVSSVGALGGACRPDGTCDPGGRCRDGLCVACTPGTAGCACDGGHCGPGLACSHRNTCTVANPKCYTPCLRGLSTEQGYRPCPADGLMPGCIGDAVCVNGTCLQPTASNRSTGICRSDVECPDFQTCLEGQCVSTCEDDTQCGSGTACYRHVCRTPCVTTASTCDRTEYCQSQDGTHGFCMPLREPTGNRTTEVVGTFTVQPQFFEFSNLTVSGTLTIVNQSPVLQRFTVRKRSHSRPTGGTSLEVVEYTEECETNPSVCPLFWLTLDDAPVRAVEVAVEANGSATVKLGNASGVESPNWTGVLEIQNTALGVQTVALSYSERPEGRWTGTLYYFTVFGTEGLQEWSENREGPNGEYLLEQVQNALLRRWGAFRRGGISWDELQAVLSAIRSESWRFPAVMKACPGNAGGKGNKACYLYVPDSGGTGIAELSSDLTSNPVPTGVTEMPFAVNLWQPYPEQPEVLAGRIETSLALQYPGNPAIAITLGTDPKECELEAWGSCITFVRDLQATIYVGGRYTSSPDDGACGLAQADGSFTQVSTPWLLPDFARATTLDAQTGLRYRYECLDTRLPNAGETEEVRAANASLSQANPVPDGRTRKRTLKVIDGALIDQTTLLLFVEESFESFLGETDTAGFKAYGFVRLERARTDVDLSDRDGNGTPDAFEGATAVDTRPAPTGLLNVQCSDDLLRRILGPNAQREDLTEDGNAERMVQTLIEGYDPSAPPAELNVNSQEEVHYLCVDTGLFDGGPKNVTRHGITTPSITPNNNACNASKGTPGKCEDGAPDTLCLKKPGADPDKCWSNAPVCDFGTDLEDCGPRTDDDRDPRVVCPATSEVIFFTVNRTTRSQEQIANDSCQTSRTCYQRLQEWRTGGQLMQYQPRWRCADPNQVYCDANRYDLRDGKVFFAAPVASQIAPFNSLAADAENAFRYKLRFTTRSGGSVGFTPLICDPNSSLTPYCYEPALIEELRGRADCLMDIWANFYDRLGAGARDKLDKQLRANFSKHTSPTGGDRDGLERLYAELLIMLGDEAYTAAFASRFDLANSRTRAFEGTLFERDGINLSGVAGLEMYNLYQSVQYYQEVLDRFYQASPLVWQSLKATVPSHNFVTQQTIVLYFDKLIRASTQKSRAYNEIARRYLGFNRPDLARRVIERAYTAMYLESVVLSRMMLGVIEVASPADRAQIVRAVEEAQRTYRMAALDMRTAYGSITDSTTYFGFTADFVPLPAVDPSETNAFRMVLGRALEKAAVARAREDQALEESKAYESDAASFQAELVNLRNNYESQLGSLCGTFQTADGRIWPAIKKYAELLPTATLLGDPCGYAGNGQIHEAMVEMELLGLELQSVIDQYDGLFKQVDIERQRVEKQCELINERAEYMFERYQEKQGLETAIFTAQTLASAANQWIEYTRDMALAGKCIMIVGAASGTDCAIAGAAAATYASTATAARVTIVAAEAAIFGAERGKDAIDAKAAKWETKKECDAARIESDATTANLLLAIESLNIELLKAQRNVALGLTRIESLRNEAARLQLEQAEAEELAINIEEARNDPNVRIYRNDAILNADFSFNDAVREAYRATKVFEYYTSQSYAPLEKLFLVRMVARGQENLENYLIELENAFNDFEQEYGLPDDRVAVVSLRDDVLRVPRLGPDGLPLSEDQRAAELRARLADVRNLDAKGYLTFPFGTELAALSPLTRNHKIKAVEAEIIGSDVGDPVARVYLRQAGTGVVKSLSDEKLYYRLPERTAVINPFFNGERVFPDEVYRNGRLRDRPLVNTGWELVINQRDERANQDVNLQSLTDVKIYLYYTDFTAY